MNIHPQPESSLPAGVWLDSRLGRDVCVRGGHFMAATYEREFDAYVLTFYVAGRSRLRRVIGTTEEVCDVGPGILSLHPPHLPARWIAESGIDVLGISIDPGFLRQIALEEVGSGRARTMSIPPILELKDDVLLQLGGAFLDELRPPLPFASARGARAIVERMAIHLLRRYAVFRTGCGRSRTFTPDEVATLRAVVSERLPGTVSIAELARVVGLSEQHFFRVFRETFDTTPYDYLQGQRIERAYELVVMTAKSLAEIAMLTGFSDQSHLTRSFKRRFNAPPSKFRHGPGTRPSSPSP